MSKKREAWGDGERLAILPIAKPEAGRQSGGTLLNGFDCLDF
jgi:hypothetical protein